MYDFRATVISFKSDGISPTLHLKCRNDYQENSYIFNMPPSLFRVLDAHGLKKDNRFQAAFIPEISVSSMGGLQSALLDVRNSIHIISPYGVNDFINGLHKVSKAYQIKEVITNEVTKMEDNPVYEDNLIRVRVIPIEINKESNTIKNFKDKGNIINNDINCNEIEVIPEVEAVTLDDDLDSIKDDENIIEIDSDSDDIIDLTGDQPMALNPEAKKTSFGINIEQDDKQKFSTKYTDEMSKEDLSLNYQLMKDEDPYLQLKVANIKRKRQERKKEPEKHKKKKKQQQPRKSKFDSVPEVFESSPPPIVNEDLLALNSDIEMSNIRRSKDEVTVKWTGISKIKKPEPRYAEKFKKGKKKPKKSKNLYSEKPKASEPEKTTYNKTKDRGEVIKMDKVAMRLAAFSVRIKKNNTKIIILFLKELTDIDDIESNMLWKLDLQEKEIQMIHLTSLEIIETSKYKLWLRKLPGKQLVCLPNYGEGDGYDIGFIHMLDRGARLFKINPTMFPLPFTLNKDNRPFLKKVTRNWPDNVEVAWSLTSSVKSSLLEINTTEKSPLKAFNIDEFMKLNLEGNEDLDNQIKILDKYNLNNKEPWKYYQCMLENNVQDIYGEKEGFDNQSVDDYKRFLLGECIPKVLKTMIKNKATSKILFLGTGCAQPSYWRGGSAILVRISDSAKSILLDCGEGTYGQIVRYFGDTGAKNVINVLSCIWISHHHMDHCGGIAEILSNRDSAKYGPLTLLCEPLVHEYLSICYSYLKYDVDYVVSARTPRLKCAKRLFNNVLSDCDIQSFESVSVNHCRSACGCVILFHNGFKLVYSGDTTPHDELIEKGENAHLLIHESTYSMDEYAESLNAKHSTWEEALLVAKRMNVYRLILTHFSRRYPFLPTGLFPTALGENSSVAFDGMNIILRHLPFIPAYNFAIYESLLAISNTVNLISDNEDDEIILLSD